MSLDEDDNFLCFPLGALPYLNIRIENSAHSFHLGLISPRSSLPVCTVNLCSNTSLNQPQWGRSELPHLPVRLFVCLCDLSGLSRSSPPAPANKTCSGASKTQEMAKNCEVVFIEFHFPDLKIRDISMAGSSEIWNSSCINDPSVRKIPTRIYRASLSLTVFIPIWSAAIFTLIASPPPPFYFLPTFSLHLVHLQGVSPPPPPPSPSSYGKVNEYLFQRQEQREAASGQRHPSSPLPSPLFAGIRAVWMRVNEGHLVADWEPNTPLLSPSSSNSDVLLCFCSCVGNRHQRPPAVIWYRGGPSVRVGFGWKLRACGCSL